MMNADDCRKRADECLAAAQYASDGDARRTWRELADMWLLWSEQLDKFGVRNDQPSAAASAENVAGAVPAADPIIELGISGNGNAAEIANRLRSRLALNDMNDA